jgi:hypothetical protein
MRLTFSCSLAITLSLRLGFSPPVSLRFIIVSFFISRGTNESNNNFT